MILLFKARISNIYDFKTFNNEYKNYSKSKVLPRIFKNKQDNLKNTKMNRQCVSLPIQNRYIMSV